MSQLYEKSIQKLELNKVLEMLSSCAGSEQGKAICLNLNPVSDVEDVRCLLDETTAAYNLSTGKGYPSFSGVADVSEYLDRAQRGGCLNARELLAIAAVLRCTRNVSGYISEDDKATVLDELFHSLTPNKYLEDKIFGSIISEDEIADAASTELADIRRHMRIQSSKIKETLQKVISSPAYAKVLREPIITIRQGRYVVPVKSECKNDIPGLVHDVSATGSTYFIEPMSAVNANNALRELELREAKEIERILSELSSEAAAHQDDIGLNVTILLRLDVIFAKAKLSYRMGAWAPEMNADGRITLRNAKHPLIDPSKVVPISLTLGTDFDTMIITGPNTGGKTVTLKTVGLLTLMAECGLHIPAGEGSCLSTFDAILADIGDEQSIAQSLSTFSSHMRTIVDIVSESNHRSLVLFDELGAGTDPAEGAALAVALIEYCRKTGSRVMATTHYAELKLYAMRTSGVINASCEFNVETLQPTYKLLIGVPGKSNAFAISRKLGLMESIIKEASDLVGKNDKDFDEVLSQLEGQRQQMEQARLEAEQLRRQTEALKVESEEYQKQLEKERERAMEQARVEAQQIIANARRAANNAAEEIKQIKKQLAESADHQGINQKQTQIRKSLNDAEDALRANQPVRQPQKPSREIIVGDTVELYKLGAKGNVIGINKDSTLQIQAGIMKFTAKIEDLILIEQKNAYHAKPKRPAHSGREMKMEAVVSEIDLRGMDSVEAITVLERYLDEAMRSNTPQVRIIHGKGTGTLRAAVQQSLRKNKFVKKFRLGLYGEGEDGVTIAEFS